MKRYCGTNWVKDRMQSQLDAKMARERRQQAPSKRFGAVPPAAKDRRAEWVARTEAVRAAALSRAAARQGKPEEHSVAA